MTGPSRHGVVPALLAVVALAGCGGSEEPEGEPIPRGAVSELERRLDEVQDRYDAGVQEGIAGACNDIENDSYPAIDATVAGLPQNVDPEVRQALADSIGRLKELTSDCVDRAREQEPVNTAPEPPPLPEPEPEPVPDETDTEEHTTPDEELPPAEDPNGKEGGDEVPPGQGGTPPGQGGTPPGQGGGQFAPEDE